MPTIVDFPTIVKAALDIFGDLFANEPARQHFAEYLTGLMGAERKNVSGINREFAVTTDQSWLNRWLSTASWDAKALNDRRLEGLQRDPKRRYSRRGVSAIDNTLVDHSGKLIEDVGWFWEHAHERYVSAHDYILSNYVCPSGAHYPMEWRRFKKKDPCDQGPFKDQTQWWIESIDDAIARDIPGDFTFDSDCTSTKVLNHIHGQNRAYVGDLKLNRNVIHDGRQQKWKELARQIRWQDKKPIRYGTRR
jgi:hypothetical protein